MSASTQSPKKALWCRLLRLTVKKYTLDWTQKVGYSQWKKLRTTFRSLVSKMERYWKSILEILKNLIVIHRKFAWYVGFDEFRPIRYSKEDTAPLWRRGQDSVVLLDPETLEVKAEYSNFWPEGYVPMFLTIKSDRSSIYGYSMSSSDSLLTVMQIQGAKTSQNLTKVPGEHKWAGMELSTDENCLVVAKSCKK